MRKHARDGLKDAAAGGRPDLGERDGWPYLVITRLEGDLGSDVWLSLPEDQKERVLAGIGATIAEVQRAPPGTLRDIEPHWDVFFRQGWQEQADNLVQLQELIWPD